MEKLRAGIRPNLSRENSGTMERREPGPAAALRQEQTAVCSVPVLQPCRTTRTEGPLGISDHTHSGPDTPGPGYHQPPWGLAPGNSLLAQAMGMLASVPDAI